MRLPLWSRVWLQRGFLRLRRVKPALDPKTLEALVENHRRFLAFLERRVGSRAEAEDLLQDGFVRALERADSLRDQESAVAWFYRLLRNALVDHYRRRAAEGRALAEAAGRADVVEPGPDAALRDVVCQCTKQLLPTLRPEYAAALQRVDVDEVSVAAFAREAGITPNNAGVRLHRAREALRRQVLRSCRTCAEHGCEDCTCARDGSRQ